MKLCVKKIYCADCRRLVNGRETQMEDGNTRVSCPRCGKPLYDWNGVTWRPVRQAT